MESVEILVGTISKEFLSYMEQEKKTEIIEQELHNIFFNHLLNSEKTDMILLDRNTGIDITQKITSDILKKIESSDPYMYLDIYFKILSYIWRCLPPLEEPEEEEKKF